MCRVVESILAQIIGHLYSVCRAGFPARRCAQRVSVVLTVLLLAHSLAGCSEGRICTESLPESVPFNAPPTESRAPGAPSDEAPHFVTARIPTERSRFPYNHAASIVELPNGDLLTAWGAGSRELGPDTVILVSRRGVGEISWSEPVVAADKPDFADANPVLFVDDAGTVHLFHVEMFGDAFCLGTVVVQTSTDNGRSWSACRRALDAVCVMVRNKPIITRTGRWILPGYVQGIYQSQFWISSDGGSTWRGTAPLFSLPNNLQPAVVELGDGSLFALTRTAAGGGFIWQARSADGGETWALCKRLDLANPDSAIDMLRLADGRLVLVYNNSTTERTPLVATISTDEGKTWSPAKIIEAGPPQLSYPSITQSRNGNIHVVYSCRLEHIQHAEFNLAWLDTMP
ncbi:MAG: exo-alpha-sialidase [Phycisphaerae bacterium]|nr:exo-alpha-sialidase [Phycisphaerae bacterium]